MLVARGSWRQLGQADMPSYQTAAEVLERKTGSGIRLLGWTVLRTALILPGFLILRVPWKKAVAGSFIASGLISTLVLIRIAAAAGRKQAQTDPLVKK